MGIGDPVGLAAPGVEHLVVGCGCGCGCDADSSRGCVVCLVVCLRFA